MRGVRDKAAALLLGLLQRLGHGVEVAAELGELVVAFRLQAVGIVALAHGAHGLGEPRYAHGEAPREHERKREGQGAGQEGHRPQPVAEGEDYIRLCRVPLTEVHGAQHSPAAGDGHRRVGDEGPVRELGVEHPLAVQGAYDLREQRQAALCGGRGRIIEHAPGRIRDHDALEVRQAQQLDHLGRAVSRERVQRRERGGDDPRLLQKGALLLGEHYVPGGCDRICVEQNQQRGYEREEGQRELELHAPGQLPAHFFARPLHSAR